MIVSLKKRIVANLIKIHLISHIHQQNFIVKNLVKINKMHLVTDE